MQTVLVVDDESGIREFMADALAEAGHETVQAGDASEAISRLEDQPFDLLILDLRMPGPLGGMDVLRRARAEWPDMQIIVLTAHGSVETAVEAMKLGAFDFLVKPIEGPAELRRLAARALNWRSVRNGIPLIEAAADTTEMQSHAEKSGALRGFLWQLKRRHVYNVAATYAAMGFIGLQVAELVLPAVPVPSWTYSLLVGATIVGFPVALVVGWIYDITSVGVKRTRSADKEVSA
jgi:DNA-binding NtrC family response regulator